MEALEWARLCAIDLVIADRRMPVMAGTDFVRAVRRPSPDTICILLTGHPDSRAVTAWRDHEIRHLVCKP